MTRDIVDAITQILQPKTTATTDVIGSFTSQKNLERRRLRAIEGRL